MAGGRGAGAQAFPRGVLRFQDRAEQGEARNPLRVAGGDMLRNQGSEGMADHMCAIDAEMDGGVLDRFDQ